MLGGRGSGQGRRGGRKGEEGEWSGGKGRDGGVGCTVVYISLREGAGRGESLWLGNAAACFPLLLAQPRRRGFGPGCTISDAGRRLASSPSLPFSICSVVRRMIKVSQSMSDYTLHCPKKRGRIEYCAQGCKQRLMRPVRNKSESWLGCLSSPPATENGSLAPLKRLFVGGRDKGGGEVRREGTGGERGQGGGKRGVCLGAMNACMQVPVNQSVASEISAHTVPVPLPARPPTTPPWILISIARPRRSSPSSDPAAVPDRRDLASSSGKP